MHRTVLTVAIELASLAAPDLQRAAAFNELRLMLKHFRRVPFTTNGDHEEIFITDVRHIAEPPPDG